MFLLDIAFLLLSKIGYKLNILSEETHNAHIINLCKQNGVVFIKMCQIMTSSFGGKAKRDLGINLFEQMSVLQDACHQDNPRHLPGINYLEPRPIASGSIAQVYKINYNDKVSALKILLPDIEKSIMESIELFTFFRSSLYYINIDLYWHFNLYDLDDYFLFLKKQIRLDKEAENFQTFQTIFSDIDRIIIPRIYYSDSTKIIMSYEEGMTLQVLEKRHPEFYHEALFLIIGFFLTGFKNNIMHGDFHLGNYLYRIENGILKLIVLDFGIIAPIDNSIKNGIISLFSDLTLTKNDRINLSINIMENNGLFMKPGARVDIFDFNSNQHSILSDFIDLDKSKIRIDLLSLGLIFPSITSLIHDITLDHFLIKLANFLFQSNFLS